MVCHTRFGKSFVVALAILTRVATFPEKWCIVAGSDKKAKIIMSYIIEHAFDNEYTSSRLDVGKDDTKRRVQREKSKNRLTFRLSEGRMGEVFVLSGDSSNKQKAGDSVMGFGAPNLILDEAALVDDQIESKIFRMLGDSMDNFYCKIGNPFKRNHFLKSSRDPKYYQMNIDYKIGLKEGRLTEDFIEEAKQKPNFSVLYENKFPEADTIDEKGWSQLILEKELDLAKANIDKKSCVGIPIMGVDVARGGGCENVWAVRWSNYAKIVAVSRQDDLMDVAAQTVRLANEWGIYSQNVFVDDNGVGGGVTDRCNQMQFPIRGVKVQEKASDYDDFVNCRAELAWRLKKWLANGGKLCDEDNWEEVLNIKYTVDAGSGKIKIMSKIEMARDGYPSPDRFDSLALTFYREPFNQKLYEAQKSEESFDRYKII